MNLIVTIVILAFVAVFTGQAEAGPEDCLECHSNPRFAKDGKPPLTLETYEAGVHGKTDCIACHIGGEEGGYDVVPHEAQGEEPHDCIFCHALGKTIGFPDIVKEYEESVHEQRLAGTFNCSSCHDPHSMVLAAKGLDREARVEAGNHACLFCHANAEFRVAALDGDQIPPSTTHDWLPSLEKHARMRCVVCHTSLEGDHDHQILPKEQATRACDACHAVDAPIIRKYLGLDDRKTWVTHPILFEEAYLPGAVRNRLADTIIVGLFGLTILGTLGHGLIRTLTGARRKATPYTVESTDLYPLGLRLWHWTNAFLFVALAFTGLRIHFGGRWGSGLSFESAFNIHNLAGAAMALLAIVYFIQNAVTRNARQYFGPPQDGIRGIIKQARFYLVGIFRGEPHPYHTTAEVKFNPLQKITYLGAMYVLFPIMVASGIVLLFPGNLPAKLGDRPAAWWFATVHYLSACALILFLLGHLYLTTTGDKVGYLISAMLTGKHKHHVPQEVDETTESEAEET